MTDVRQNPKPTTLWGLYNWGHLWDVGYRQKDLRTIAEQASGQPWKKCRAYYEIHRVEVRQVRAAR
jgi:hypothetical protein